MSRLGLKLVLAWAIMFSGCSEVAYYGPFALSVPTEIMERAASRVFQLPLDQADRDQQQRLIQCLDTEPDRDPPCLCTYPVLTVAEQNIRLDYLLRNEENVGANIMVWLGRALAPHELSPATFGELPDIEVIAEHHFEIPAGTQISNSFLEDEIATAKSALAEKRHISCDLDVSALPTPVQLYFGLFLDSLEQSTISAEFSFRVRENGP